MDVDEQDRMNARLFALTFADDGPNIGEQPHPLWNSRTKVQYASGHHTTPSSLPLDEVRQGILRTLISSGMTSTKKDRRKQKDLKSLDAMDKLLVQCNMKLSLGLPDGAKFALANYNKLCDALPTISRNVTVVQERKEDIRMKLRLLKARLDSLPPSTNGPVPVQYDACKLFCLPRSLVFIHAAIS